MLSALQQQVKSRGMTPKTFRQYLHAASREWAEGERWSCAWAPHLSQCRSLLDTMIDDIVPRRIVLVLGSGAMRELPVESLGRCFERVVLVDRVHLAAGLRRTARYRQIERVWSDVAFPTGDLLGRFVAGFGPVDWVISANILPELGAADGGRHAMGAHLDGLAALACPATLISALDKRILNRHGVLLDGGSLLNGRDMPRSGQRWKWERRPLSSRGQSWREVRMVGAWADWRQSQ